MRLMRLEAENIKRLRAVAVDIEGNLFIIGGRNAQGKTSLLDSLEYALSGEKAICDEPIRHGEKKARVIAEFDNMVVTRNFTGKGSYLSVKNKDGLKYSSPQAMLDKLCSKFGFDPLAFTRLNDSKQAEEIRKVLGIDFSGIDEKREDLYNKRKELNQAVKMKQGEFNAIPKDAEMNIPDSPIESAALVTELQSLNQVEGEAKQAQLKLNNIKNNLFEARYEMEELAQRIGEMEKDEQKAKEGLETVSERIEALRAREEIENELANVSRINEAVKNRERAKTLRDEIFALKKQSDQFSSEIAKLDEEKRELLASKNFPVEGLSFDPDGGLLFNGLPFKQASSAQQLKISTAMGFCASPELKLVLIRDGSLLDEESLKAIGSIAAEYDGLVLMERVGEGKECQVIIEDGEIVGRGASIVGETEKCPDPESTINFLNEVDPDKMAS